MPLPANPQAGRPYTGSLPPLAVFNEPERFTRIEGPDGRLLAIFEGETLYYRNESAIIDVLFPDNADTLKRQCYLHSLTPAELLEECDRSAEETRAAFQQMAENPGSEQAKAWHQGMQAASA